jgi:hypothetical protein
MAPCGTVVAVGDQRRSKFPTQAACIGLRRRALRLLHGRDRGRIQDALVAQQRLGETGQVVGRAEQSGMACDAAHASGGRVVHDAPQLRARQALGRRDAWNQSGRRSKARVEHAQRRQDALPDVAVQRHSRHTLHELAQHDEVDVAVERPRAGLCHGGVCADAPQGLRAPGPCLAQVEICAQTGTMREQLAHGDLTLAVDREVDSLRMGLRGVGG